jgi:DNA-binding NtrC family response regulator
MDLPILANHFLKKVNKLKKKDVQRIAPAAMNMMMEYPWPGNVRELENLVEMLVVMKEEGEIGIEDLPNKISQRKISVSPQYGGDFPEEGVDFNNMVVQFEKDLLLKALDKCGGVKNKAAKMLNLNRTTLVEKLKRL